MRPWPCLLTLVCLIGFVGCAAAQAEEAGGKPLSADSSVDEILDALDARGKNLKDFSATVDLEEADTASADSSIRNGRVVYQKKPGGDARILVSFKTITQDNKTKVNRQDYLLDNGWLIDRDYQKRIETNHQVLRPGEKMDLLKLGEGPFPLPIGQSKEAVHKEFDVTKPAADKSDVEGTAHVTLKPRDGTSLAKRFTSIDVYVDLKSHMPRKIVTLDKNQVIERSTVLKNLEINTNPADSEFALPAIGNDWNRSDKPFND